MKPHTKKIFNEPSWRISTPQVEAWLTETGGQLGPVTFKIGRRKIQPFSIAPWWNERLDNATPPVVRVLRGDFFCLPFGGNGTAFGKERHPVHGETANKKWTLKSFTQDRTVTSVHCTLNTRIRKGRVDKHIELRRGEHAIYQQHVVSGMTGPMSFGHHAMLKFPDAPGSGVLSFSPFKLGHVWLEPVERPENRGYSMLKPAAVFESLERVPTVYGDTTDLTRYPARRGYEDLVLLAADDSLPLAWSAVVFPDERYVWFSLRDPKILASTILWLSNGGRHFAPWNGRHVNVMGIEDVTSFFHPGISESVNDNPLTRRGIRTSVALSKTKPLVVNHIMAVADLPHGFDRVAEILPRHGAVKLVSQNGTSMDVPLDIAWLKAEPCGNGRAGSPDQPDKKEPAGTAAATSRRS